MSLIGKSLYNMDSKGKIREWVLDVFDCGTYSEILITAGIKDGKMVPNIIRISEGKNIGRSNETTHYTQAIAEGEAKIELQLRSGYVEDIADVKQHVLGSGLSSPMLAQKYHPTGAQSGSKTLVKMGLIGKKIIVQPKLDGNRCLIVCDDNGEATMYTRKGDVFPVQLEHILKDVLQVTENLGGEYILDGELFSDEMSFNETNGLLKKFKVINTDKLRKIKFHLYDVLLEGALYPERLQFIRLFDTENIIPVPSYEIVATDTNIHETLEVFLAEGHEGLMIRRLDMPYENKRSWGLVKVKLFEDDEFQLADVEEDSRGGFVGAFVMKLHEPTQDRDGNIITTFKAGVSGLTQDEGRDILRNKDKYIGRRATVEYFGVSEYNVPRFGKLKSFRD